MFKNILLVFENSIQYHIHSLTPSFPDLHPLLYTSSAMSTLKTKIKSQTKKTSSPVCAAHIFSVMWPSPGGCWTSQQLHHNTMAVSVPTAIVALAPQQRVETLCQFPISKLRFCLPWAWLSPVHAFTLLWVGTENWPAVSRKRLLCSLLPPLALRIFCLIFHTDTWAWGREEHYIDAPRRAENSIITHSLHLDQL